MGVKMKVLGIGGIISLLSVASLAVAADLRLVEAVQSGDKTAVRSLPPRKLERTSR